MAELIFKNDNIKKLCMWMIFSNLVVSKNNKLNLLMHNLYTKFVKILNIYKKFSYNLVDGKGTMSLGAAQSPNSQTWRSWPWPRLPKQRGSTARNGFSTIGWSNMPGVSQTSFPAGSSTTAGNRPHIWVSRYARGLSRRLTVRRTSSSWTLSR